MKKAENLELIFNNVQPFIGQTIQTARFARRTEKTVLAGYLRGKFGWGIGVQDLVGEIETQKISITFEQFKNICCALDFSIEQLLKLAVSLRNCAETPEENMRIAMNNFEYLIFQKQNS